MRRTTAMVFLWAALASGAALANDSEAERALGGLTFTKSDAISMDSEDLYVSEKLVRVKYRFTNHSDAPVDTLVAFPMPDIPPAAETGDVGNFWSDPEGGLKFRTTIDGTPAELQVVQQALFKGRDISARLTGLGLPLNRYAEGFSTLVNRLPAAERQNLISDGLITDAGEAREKLWDGQWTLKTAITRRQAFPPRRTVTVEHEYQPLIGGSVGGGLDPQQRTTPWFRQERAKFCIDDGWLASFDRRFAARRGKVPPYSETWIGYVLTTGANWRGPIGDFRLVVDKGDPNSLVSFCGEGVKKISPTQFEMRKRDFTPTKDLNVLIVKYPQASD